MMRETGERDYGLGYILQSTYLSVKAAVLAPLVSSGNGTVRSCVSVAAGHDAWSDGESHPLSPRWALRSP